ncbi:ABC-type nitrate/sulfonate/bicarbonate transport system permease component [Microbacterium endophyticum]|uniref:ABC-type nitrate/sulfonate/bicarbonate transport system permease component n=1 Tax=Microbacterium endophyticum TaxID=1526412 RepID=A0A7W4YPV1_9MICO|nr:ABC transporter permease subunit [Microbacterium endophyticum]MBB2977126.1 ABC-type nitrate/sulfonate/bicarbonate transport system permease component [Microbacterium endophyticum]NIK36054.1 ABC-type nitrate/sulfonate/bicarbonate transport system permease component [Microbacterium endophyticum]
MTTDAPARGRAIQWEDVKIPAWLSGTIGGVGLVALWWIISAIWVSPNGTHPIPSPPEVILSYFDSGWDFYWRNFSVTLEEAGIGYVWGNGLALLLSAVVLIVPRLEGVAMQLAILTYCVPIVAIGFIAVVLFGAPPVGEPSGTAVFLAALSVFFTTVVGALLGLKSADKTSLDLITVYGGSKFTQLIKVRLIAALPAILNALQIAVPAAFLGAVLGEFFGKVEAGVGLAMILAQQNSDAPLVWALALASGAVALLGFGLVGLIARLVAPWSKGTAS